ncbi:MAG: cell division protein ZapA [Firmicutes bacterium]|nr:cell division protein ZapA [Bacillota bacterium]
MGEEYTIRGNGPPESMEKAASYVDHLMRSLSEENRQLNSYKVAVLTAINLADELLKSRDSYPHLDTEEREKEGEDELV